jgi:hypothetical protein
MSLNLTDSKKATLKHLAAAGDMMAQALVQGITELKLSAAAEAGNAIVVTGQVVDVAGNPVQGVKEVVVKSYAPTALKGYLTVGTGTLKTGGTGTTNELWIETNSSGLFTVSVADDQVESVLVKAETDSGETALLKITFA